MGCFKIATLHSLLNANVNVHVVFLGLTVRDRHRVVLSTGRSVIILEKVDTNSDSPGSYLGTMISACCMVGAMYRS